MAGDLILSLGQILVSSYNFIINSITTFSRSLNGNLLEEIKERTTSSVYVASVVLDVTGIALETFWEMQNQINGLIRPMARTSLAPNQVTGL
jgi:hypothetical protein